MSNNRLFIFVNVFGGTPTPLVISVLLSLNTLAGIFAVSVELENPAVQILVGSEVTRLRLLPETRCR